MKYSNIFRILQYSMAWILFIGQFSVQTDAGLNQAEALMDEGQAESLVQKALEKYREDEVTMEMRLNTNVDRPVPEFNAIAPPMLSAHTAPLSAETIKRNSRIINRIMDIARNSNSSLSLQDYLLTQAARLDNVQCPFLPVSCGAMPGRYRSYDGRCNNLLKPLWGAAYTPFVRQLEAVYESEDNMDGQGRRDLPRRHGVDGSPLPSARVVSNVVHVSSHAPIGTTVTSLYTIFGQSLSHDLSDTPMEKGFGGSQLLCCNQAITTNRCFNIGIPSDDFFRSYARGCMGFIRSAEVTDLSCQTGQREQLNIASAFIDLTVVYGHTSEHANILRGEKGQLLFSFPNNLPYQSHPNKKAFQQGINVLLSGDEKTGEFPGLTGINTLLLREHNRIASKLIRLKKNVWKGQSYSGLSEEIYQTSRRILIACIQHITYSEYLPVTIGLERMTSYDLNPLKVDYYHGYDPTVDPSISNVFATAAMRFGHSMIRDTYSLLDESYGKAEESLRLKKIYWRNNFYTKYEDGLWRGVLVDDSEMCDRHVGVDLRNHMFETRSGDGLDLAALNIQRGRDHGLPSYNEYRRLFSLTPAKEWSVDPNKGFQHMTQEVVHKLRAVYRSPEDVDVWTGGLSETPVEGGQTGPLFADILALQFQKLRRGDYFWYENVANGLTKAQLAEIRKYSLAKMICNNFPVETIQPRVFQLHSVRGNARVSCDSLPDINFHRW